MRWSHLMKPPSSEFVVDYTNPFNDGLLLWWAMNENGGTSAFDYSRNGYKGTATITSPSTNWVVGKFGKCLSLNGTSEYIAAPSTIPELEVQRVTVSAWATCNALGTYDLLAGYTDGSSEGYRIWQDSSNMKFGVQTWNTNNATAATLPTDGTWHHVVGTYDGANTRIYVDGVEGTSAAETAAITYVTIIPFQVGFSSAWTYWDGKVDNVQVWNRALSTSEVTELYAQPFAGIWTPRKKYFIITGGIPYTKALSESFSLTDTPKKAASKPVSESVSLTDLILKLSGKNLTESVVISDNLAKLLIRILTETITTSDTLDLVVFFVKALTESISLSDAAIRLTGKPLSEGVTLTDGQSHDVTRALIESLSLNSLITKLTGKTATESISLSDALATAITFVKLLTEGLSLTDNQQRSVNRALIESLTLTGGLTRESFKTFVESLGLSDTFASEAVAIVVAFIAEILLRNYYNIQIDLSPLYSVDIESEPLYSLEPEID